jgi:hypothetical protein
MVQELDAPQDSLTMLWTRLHRVVTKKELSSSLIASSLVPFYLETMLIGQSPPRIVPA